MNIFVSLVVFKMIVDLSCKKLSRSGFFCIVYHELLFSFIYKAGCNKQGSIQFLIPPQARGGGEFIKSDGPTGKNIKLVVGRICIPWQKGKGEAISSSL